jgi:hypothetical protein
MDWLVMMLVVIQMETSGNPNMMVGDGGMAIGIVQIHEIVVREYNEEHKTSYHHEDVRNPVLSIAICKWYLQKWGKDSKSPSDLYRIWNGGPKGKEKNSTYNKGKKAEKLYAEFSQLPRKEQLAMYRKWIAAFDVKTKRKMKEEMKMRKEFMALK